jgi:hypothetical protein
MKNNLLITMSKPSGTFYVKGNSEKFTRLPSINQKKKLTRNRSFSIPTDENRDIYICAEDNKFWIEFVRAPSLIPPSPPTSKLNAIFKPQFVASWSEVSDDDSDE